MFRIILFKIFNTEPTWQALEKEFGDITLDNFDAEVYGEFIEKLSCKSKPSINFIYPPKWGLDFTNDKK